MIRGFELVTRRSEPVTHGFELVTGGFELATHGFELVTQGFELELLKLSTRTLKLLTRNSCFTISHFQKLQRVNMILRPIFFKKTNLLGKALKLFCSPFFWLKTHFFHEKIIILVTVPHFLT